MTQSEEAAARAAAPAGAAPTEQEPTGRLARLARLQSLQIIIVLAVIVDQQRRAAALRGGPSRVSGLLGRMISRQGDPARE